jgi:hypothetical protein
MLELNNDLLAYAQRVSRKDEIDSAVFSLPRAVKIVNPATSKLLLPSAAKPRSG